MVLVSIVHTFQSALIVLDVLLEARLHQIRLNVLKQRVFIGLILIQLLSYEATHTMCRLFGFRFYGLLRQIMLIK